MVDPVVSSRYGTRPLLNIPAMEINGSSHMTVSSLQGPPAPQVVDPFRTAHNPMLGSGLHDPLPTYYTTDSLSPAPYGAVKRPYHTAPPAETYYQNGRQYYYGSQGEIVRPLPVYQHQPYPGVVNDPYSPYVHPVPPLPPPSEPPPPLHPPPVHRVHHPSYPPHLSRYELTCDLEYGRITRISVTETQGPFRGIPDHLRAELHRTYKKYPYTEVKLVFENGDYHIYANHGERARQQRGNEKPRDRFYDEDDDGFDNEHVGYYDSKSVAHSDMIRPRDMRAPRRTIIHEEGWNSYR